MRGGIAFVRRLRRHRQQRVGEPSQHHVVHRPVVPARVVEPHAHTLGSHRLTQLADQVSLRVQRTTLRVRHFTRPQRKTVMVF